MCKDYAVVFQAQPQSRCGQQGKQGGNFGFPLLMNQHISMVVIMVTWRADAISDRTVVESTRPRLGQLDITEQVAKIKKATSQ